MSLKINQDNLVVDILPYQKIEETNIYYKIVKSDNYI